MRVRSGNAGHDGGVGDAQAADAVDLQSWGHDARRVARWSHFTCAHLKPEKINWSGRLCIVENMVSKNTNTSQRYCIQIFLHSS